MQHLAQWQDSLLGIANQAHTTAKVTVEAIVRIYPIIGKVHAICEAAVVIRR